MSEPAPVGRDFRTMEWEGWQAVADPYAVRFGELTAQAAEPLMDAVGATNGTRLLDVASGPGYVAAAAARRGADVVGVDFSAPMVALASRLYPGIEFREGNAEDLPFANESFDAVTMNFGILHLPSPEKGVAEAYRVLRPGGRFAFTAWAKPDEAIAFKIIFEAIERHGNNDALLPPAPLFFRFSEPEEIRKVMHDAGFVNPRVTTVPQYWHLSSPDALFDSMIEATVRTRILLQAQTDKDLAAMRAYMSDAVSNYDVGGEISLPMPAVLSSATKPR